MNYKPKAYISMDQLKLSVLDYIYKSGAMGIFQKNTKQNVFEIFVNVPILELSRMTNRKNYDNQYDSLVEVLHRALFSSYNDNLKIDCNNPYSYSARLFNQFINLTFDNYYPLQRERIANLYELMHPILSNKFIGVFLPDIKAISNVKTQDLYYDILGYYRYLIDSDLNEENRELLKMLRGIDF